MNGVGARVVGVIALVLSAGSVALGFVSRVHHPRRFIGLLVLCGVFLVVGVALLVVAGRGGRAPQSSS